LKLPPMKPQSTENAKCVRSLHIISMDPIRFLYRFIKADGLHGVRPSSHTMKDGRVNRASL